MQLLKAATASRHESLERRLDLLRPDLTIHDYADLLQRFLYVYRIWEPLAAAVIDPVIPEFTIRRRKRLCIERDLAFLGIEPWLNSAASATTLSEFVSPATALGGAYVLEGSTLGGQILSRHFQTRFGITPDAGCAFFSSYGPQTGSMWRDTARCLEEYALSGGEQCRREMVCGAISMFDLLQKELCPESGSL